MHPRTVEGSDGLSFPHPICARTASSHETSTARAGFRHMLLSSGVYELLFFFIQFMISNINLIWSKNINIPQTMVCSRPAEQEAAETP